MEASGLPHAMAYLPLKKELHVYQWAPDSLDVLEKRKISSPATIQTLDCLAHSLVIIPTTQSQLLLHWVTVESDYKWKYAVFGQFSYLTNHPCKSMHKTDLEVSLRNLFVQMIYNVFCEERITLILNIWQLRMMIWMTHTKTEHSLTNQGKVLIRHNINSFINETELDL